MWSVMCTVSLPHFSFPLTTPLPFPASPAAVSPGSGKGPASGLMDRSRRSARSCQWQNSAIGGAVVSHLCSRACRVLSRTPQGFLEYLVNGFENLHSTSLWISSTYFSIAKRSVLMPWPWSRYCSRISAQKQGESYFLAILTVLLYVPIHEQVEL